MPPYHTTDSFHWLCAPIFAHFLSFSIAALYDFSFLWIISIFSSASMSYFTYFHPKSHTVVLCRVVILCSFFLSLLFYFLQGSYLYFHIICSFPYSHINEDTCIKSEPNTNPYLLLFPFRIRFTLVFVQNPILLSPPCMAGSYLASWPLSLLHALPMLKPNQPFSFPI